MRVVLLEVGEFLKELPEAGVLAAQTELQVGVGELSKNAVAHLVQSAEQRDP